MKKIITFIVVLITLPICAKDFKKTEDVINSILNESPAKSRTLEKKSEASADNKHKKIENISGKEKKGKSLNDDNSPAISTAEEALLKTGIQFFKSGLYSHSLQRFLELNSKYPQSVYMDSSRVWMGKIHIKLYKYDEAIKEFSSVPVDSGEYPTAIYYLGESYMLKGDTISSIENYQKVFSQFPEHELADNALLKTGRLYLNKKKGNQALESAIKLIKYYKTRETIDDAYFLLGKIFEKDPALKDFETARMVYKLFLKKANSLDERFRKSPLKKRVKQDLYHIEKNYFRLEN